MDCSSCREKRADPVPYIVHEGVMARQERTIKRLWILLILLVLLLVGTNAGWLWYESQFEYADIEIKQGNERGINSFIGNDGDIYYGEADYPYTEENP